MTRVYMTQAMEKEDEAAAKKSSPAVAKATCYRDAASLLPAVGEVRTVQQRSNCASGSRKRVIEGQVYTGLANATPPA